MQKSIIILQGIISLLGPVPQQQAEIQIISLK